MSKLITLFIATLLTSGHLAADAIKKDPKELLDSQLTMLDDLIVMTQRSLKGEQEVKKLIVKYQEIQAEYLTNQEDKGLVVKMVRMAHRVLTKIQDNHLTHQFDPDFISELTLFSKIATKKGLPKP